MSGTRSRNFQEQERATMQFWIIQGLNSLSLGGLLFLLSSGFSLIFGLMRLANLTHGAFFMLGTYFAAIALRSYDGLNIWVTALGAGIAVAAIGGLFERLVLTRLKANPLGQVLVTLGMSFIISDACLMLWGGDSIPVPTPQNLQSPTRIFGFVFPTYRLVLVGCAIAAAIALYFLLDRTRLGAMIRAGVDDGQMARAVGIPVSNLFTGVFCLGAGIAGAGGVLGGPILSAYPGLDADMLPLALIVVILGGIGSLLGAFIGSFIIGFIYTFGTALFPELAYIILFLPMIFVIAFRPQGLLDVSAHEVDRRGPACRIAAAAAPVRGRFLRQSSEPDPYRGDLRAQPEPAGGFWRDDVAWARVLSRGCRLHLRTAHEPLWFRTWRGRRHLDRRHNCDGSILRRHCTSRQRARVPDDHARLVAGVVGPRLSDVQCDQRRQWYCRTDAAGAARNLAR